MPFRRGAGALTAAAAVGALVSGCGSSDTETAETALAGKQMPNVVAATATPVVHQEATPPRLLTATAPERS
ncbi:hypothetical protein A5724_04405 [Mycobacterium sp. ACS1612]|uniref:hypothetical protein n=1 Tax=Mycobacterium sp. ACS1612 TaxID=1834117 RepID=UPI0007FEB2D9|nr:hypothetical protein [Mycobacterium sp. ACS1612]OBF25628.1 hypothetical protein A5724_04405 [Mycobacterium sp. ACS1612]